VGEGKGVVVRCVNGGKVRHHDRMVRGVQWRGVLSVQAGCRPVGVQVGRCAVPGMEGTG